MYHVSTLLPFSSDDRQQVLTVPTHVPISQYLNLQPGRKTPHSHFYFNTIRVGTCCYCLPLMAAGIRL
jgi:hypothetical protein